LRKKGKCLRTKYLGKYWNWLKSGSWERGGGGGGGKGGGRADMDVGRVMREKVRSEEQRRKSGAQEELQLCSCPEVNPWGGNDMLGVRGSGTDPTVVEAVQKTKGRRKGGGRGR